MHKMVAAALAGTIGGMALCGTAAQAVPIMGSFSVGLSSGSYAGTGGAPATARTALGLDFGLSALGGGTGNGNGYGVDGSAIVYNTSGSFASLIGSNASVTDLALSAGGVSSPYTMNPFITLGVYTFQVTNATFTRSPLGTSDTVTGTGTFSNGVPADTANGTFSLSTSSRDGVASDPNFTFTGSFMTTAATLPQAAAAVPEPATWAMMIFGFGGVGATMRRRKVTASFA